MASSLQQFPKTGEAPPEAQNSESCAFAQFCRDFRNILTLYLL